MRIANRPFKPLRTSGTAVALSAGAAKLPRRIKILYWGAVSDTPRQLCAQDGLELRDDLYVIAAGDFNVAVVAVERAEQHFATPFHKLL